VRRTVVGATTALYNRIDRSVWVRDEGQVKFESDLYKSPPPSEWDVEEVNLWRDRLYALGYIGAYDDGVGYGNISIRPANLRQFIITGTSTGKVPMLGPEHFTRVSSYDIDRNAVVCEGKVHASSESMTHAAVYACDPSVRAVIHIHSKPHWDRLLGRIPTTSESAAYGTPEMAREIKRLFDETDFATLGVMVMAGHEEGILSFGPTLTEAGRRLMDAIDRPV